MDDDGCALPCSDVILLLYKLKPITIRRLNRYAYTDLWALMRIRRRAPTAVGVRTSGRSCRQHVSDRMTHALSAGY